MHGKLSEWNCLCASNGEGKRGEGARERSGERTEGERERGEEGRAKLRTGPVRGRRSGGGSRTASGIAGVTSNEHDKQTDVHSLKA